MASYDTRKNRFVASAHACAIHIRREWRGRAEWRLCRCLRRVSESGRGELRAGTGEILAEMEHGTWSITIVVNDQTVCRS